MNIRQLRAAVLRLRGVLWSGRLERDLAEEIESHLQLHVEDNLRAGMTPEEARRQALLALGGVEATKERLRDRRGLPAIDTLAQDLRLAVRSLRRAPGFTVAVVLMLGIGIAAVTATFSGVNAGILGSTPGVSAEDELVRVSLWRPAPGGGSFLDTTFGDFLALQEGVSGLSGLSANHEVTFAVSIEGQPLTLRGALVSGNYFDVLGTRFTHGRGFIVLGAAGAAAGGVIVRSALHGASAVDPGALAGASAVLVLTMLVASVIPAHRAARVDPIVVLRDE